MKKIVVYQFTVKLNGKYRTSPEYKSEKERLAAVACFLDKYPLRLTVNFFTNVRYVAEAENV